jgi:hypothetical protein
MLRVVEPPAEADVARDVVLRAGVLNGQLPAAAPAAQKPREKRGAVLGSAGIPGARGIITDHLADRLCAVPVDVTFMRARPQCQPFLARLAPGASLRTRPVIAHGRACLAVGIRTAIGGVGDDLIDARVTGAAPDNIAVVAPGW